jgi:hypothetical protein
VPCNHHTDHTRNIAGFRSRAGARTTERQYPIVPLWGLVERTSHRLTEPALIAALKNPDPDVRFLAAMKLSEDKATDAIPQVKEAIAVEKVPRTRVNMAVALGLLGDPGGHHELKRLCADTGFPPEFRL